MFPTQRKAWQRHGGTSLRWLSPMQEKASPSPPSTGGPAAYFFLRRSPVNRKPRPSSPNQEPSPFRTGEGGSFRLPACMRPSRRPAAKETLRRSTGTPSHAGYVLDGIQPISRGNRPSSPWQHFHPTPSACLFLPAGTRAFPEGKPEAGPAAAPPQVAPCRPLSFPASILGEDTEKNTSWQEAQVRCPKTQGRALRRLRPTPSAQEKAPSPRVRHGTT